MNFFPKYLNVYKEEEKKFIFPDFFLRIGLDWRALVKSHIPNIEKQRVFFLTDFFFFFFFFFLIFNFWKEKIIF